MSAEVAGLTWDELLARAKRTGVALVPAGSTERHGSHLPMGTDAATAREVARRVGRKTGAVVFPTLTYGVSEHPAFQGAFLSDETFSAVVRELCRGIEKMGFRKILFISGHGPNNSGILSVLKELFEERPGQRLLGLAHCMTLVNQLMPDFVKDRPTGHSDFRETAIMLAINAKQVHTEKAHISEKISKKFSGNLKSTGVHLVGLERASIHLCHSIDELDTYGGYGQINGASKEDGEKILTVLSDFLCRVVDELRRIELPLA